MASYSHIELTEDEEAEALIAAKRKKEAMLNKQALENRAAENRRLFVETKWDHTQTSGFMFFRAASLFGGKFAVDETNKGLFDLLCRYFSMDEGFVSMATGLGVKGPSLDKGIMLAGNFGVGKTWLMQLFSKNQRQCFRVHNAKDLANLFESDGEESFEQFLRPFSNPVNDSASFLQKQSGLCIDDIGTEDVKSHYGNKKNVIGDLIERRYHNKHMGLMFHGTTNLTSDQLNAFYGGRVISRLRETVNFISVPGADRRK